MKKFIKENAPLGFVFVVLALAMASEGDFDAFPKFLAIILLVYGSGMLLFSDNLMAERRAWLALGLGIGLAVIFNSQPVWLYSGMIFVVQLVAFLLVQLISWFRRFNRHEDGD